MWPPTGQDRSSWGGYTTTCTASSASQNVTVGASTIFQNKDGISCYGAGATNTLSTPGAPTVTPSLAAHAMGTGVDVNAPAGSASFSYKVVALGSWSSTDASNLWGAYTAASAAGATTTGNTLGSQTQTISTLSEQNGVLTATCSAACPMSAGAYVSIIGSSNDPFFGGQYVVASVTNTTTFTVNVGNSTSAIVTGTGGTLNWFVSNHLTWTAVSGAFEYAIYGRSSGSWTLLGISWPGVTWWDDFGATMSGNGMFYGWLPTSAPSIPQNGVLTTTVSSGGGTTSLTLAAAASNNVTGGFATFDEAPLFRTAATAAIDGGGALFVSCNPATANSRFVIGSYLALSPYPTNPTVNVQQCGNLWLDDPMEWDSSLNWNGVLIGSNGGAASVALVGGAEIDVGTAYPGIYSPDATSMFIDHTYLNTPLQQNMALLSMFLNGGPGLVWQNSTWQTSGANDFMGVHLIVGPNNSTADDTFTNDSWIAGPNQAANQTTTPLVIIQNAAQVHIDNCTMNRRGIAEVGSGLAIQSRKGCWVQGPITPFLMSNATSESIGGIVLEGILMDTSGQPIFANWSGQVFGGTIEIDSPSLDSPAEEVTGSGVGNLILKDTDLPPAGASNNGQNQNYRNEAAAYTQEGAQIQGQLTGIIEQSKPNYQAQPNPQNFFIEQMPGAPSSSASAGGSLTGTHFYGVVAHFLNGTSRTGAGGNSVTLSGGNGTIVTTLSAVPGATSYDVWDLTRGLPTACKGLTTLTCTDNGGGISASGPQPNAPSDGCPAMRPSVLFNCGGPAATENPAASAATNFGTAISSTNVIASVPVTGVYNVSGSTYVSTAGVGCSAATNSATVTWAWTDATGTSQTASGPLVSVTGNSTPGATTVSGPLAIVAQTGTAISYSVASTLGSTGCSTTPKYTVQLKAFN